MRAIKPLRLGFLTRPFDFAREHRFVVTVLAPFPLREPGALVPEVDLWKLVGKQLGRFAVFDSAMWKPRGEVVVSGSCFPPTRPARACLVGLTVRDRAGKAMVDKTLQVFGDRQWALGGPGEPAPFERMPVDYTRAFGGEGFAQNPIGLGHAPVKGSDGDEVHALPNVEDPSRPIGSKGDRPPPASFAAWDPLWPVHFARMGTYDARWRDELFPGFAEDIDWSVFQVAPEDQRLPGFFEGGEAIRIVHMHPDEPKLETRVPDHLARAFLRMKGRDELEELPLRLDTVHLFPDAEIGCAIHRGVRTIGSGDGSDVELLVIAAEDREGERRPLSHYEEVVRLRSDPEKAAIHLFRDRDLLPATLAEAPPRASVDDPIEDAVQLEFLPLRRMRRKAERELEAMKRDLLEQGVAPERVHALALPDQQLETPSLDQLPELLEKMAKEVAEKTATLEAERAQATADIRAACAEQGIDYDELEAKARREGAGPPKFSASRELETLHDQRRLAQIAGVELPHVEERLADPELEPKLRAAEAELHRAYRLFGHMQEGVPRLEGDRAGEARAELLRAVAARAPLARVDFSGALLEGVDLEGADLRGIYLEGADLRGARLAGADLSEAMLGRADLSGADLRGATMRSANLGRAILAKTRLDGVALDGVTLYEAELRGTSMVGADLTGAQLLEARFEGVDMSKARGRRLFFVKSKLAGTTLVDAELEQVIFVECDLAGADLTRAVLRKATFYKSSAPRLKLTGATLDNVRFVGECDLEEADLRGAKMPLSNFSSARLQRADLSMAEASQCELSHANLEGANLYRITAVESRFAGTELRGASVRGANLRHAVFHGARVAGTDFTGSNLFGADFSGAVGDDATSFSECLVMRTIKPRKG